MLGSGGWCCGGPRETGRLHGPVAQRDCSAVWPEAKAAVKVRDEAPALAGRSHCGRWQRCPATWGRAGRSRARPFSSPQWIPDRRRPAPEPVRVVAENSDVVGPAGFPAGRPGLRPPMQAASCRFALRHQLAGVSRAPSWRGAKSPRHPELAARRRVQGSIRVRNGPAGWRAVQLSSGPEPCRNRRPPAERPESAASDGRTSTTVRPLPRWATS